MMKVFSEKKARARSEDSAEAAPAGGNGVAGGDRIAQGFDLLFGAHLKEQRQEIERVETEFCSQVEELRARSLEQAEILEELADKVDAAVERENDEHRRRKSVESELREGLCQLREFVGSAVAELHQKIEKLGSELSEQIQSQEATRTGADPEYVQDGFQQLGQGLTDLKASAIDRMELATLFAAVSRELGMVAARARGEQEE
jgi:hypothetical protein